MLRQRLRVVLARRRRPGCVYHRSCEYCHRDGHERCSECQPATDAWIEPGNSDYGERVFPLCSEHVAQYVAAAADE